MKSQNRKPLILVAENDKDDQLLIDYALGKRELNSSLQFVNDGEELLSFLQDVEDCRGLGGRCRPDLILLDLNMPRKDGREVLAKLKTDPAWRQIPVVVWTTSDNSDDIEASYRLGASSFITKPRSLESLCRTLNSVVEYWTETVELPYRADQTLL